MTVKIENIELDKENMLDVLAFFPEQIKKGVDLAANTAVKKDEIDTILISGMGGSALAGEILKSYLDIDIPIIICRNYMLPKYITEKTLVFSCSHSGNTEETVEALREATKKKCKIITMSSGGKLEEYAKTFKLKHIKLPKGMQPRNAYGYMFFIMLKILENSSIIPDQTGEIETTYKTLKKPGFVEKAQRIIDDMGDRIPIVYASDSMKSVAYKWKIGLNETAKIHAFYNVLPEMNHNELVGYESKDNRFYTIIIKDEKDYSRIKKRMNIIKGLLTKRGVDVTEMEFVGSSKLLRIFSAIYVGDFVCFLLALKRGLDPSPVDIVEDLKDMMKK